MHAATIWILAVISVRSMALEMALHRWGMTMGDLKRDRQNQKMDHLDKRNEQQNCPSVYGIKSDTT